MENNVLKFFIPFVLMGLLSVTNFCAGWSVVKERVYDVVTQEETWKSVWFTHFNTLPVDTLWCKDPKVELNRALRLISPMMGCSYSYDLNYFLLMTLEAIDECNRIPDDETAKVCKSKLSESIEAGRLIMIRLKNSLVRLHVTVINDDYNDDKFYKTLFQLEKFYTGETREVFADVIPGGSEFNNLLKKGAEHIADYLLEVCLPLIPAFDLANIKKESDPNETCKHCLHVLYIDILDSITGFFNDKLNKLPF